MNRIGALIATLFLGFTAQAFAQTTASDTLLQRIASQNGGTAEVFVGRLPTDLPKVPLPQATLVGSVHQSMETPMQIDSYQLYYDASPDAIKTYGDVLAAAGWKRQELPTNSGGFVASTGPSSAIYCKTNGPLITAQVGTDPKDLNVSISSNSNASDIVCGRSPLSAFVKAFTTSVLPQLHAPDGVRMSVSPIGVPNGQSAAYIHNGTSASALLDGFAAQMASAGWSAGAKSAGDALVSQTFAKTDDKKAPWQCTISIQAVSGKPGEFIAFIDSANVSVLSKGATTLFSH